MTRAATKLVGPKTFEALSGRPVVTDEWASGAHPHIMIARRAELMCVAPATANVLAKAALGLGDEIVTTTLLAFNGPIVFARRERADVEQAASAAKRPAQLAAAASRPSRSGR